MVFVASIGIIFYLLPLLQQFVIPKLPGGTQGPWVLRPNLKVHGIASIAAAFISVRIAQIYLARRRRDQDAAKGTQHEPSHGRPFDNAYKALKNGAILLILGSFLPAYFYSCTLITENGIEVRTLLGPERHTFAEVAVLRTIPSGMYNTTISRGGPWYGIGFADGTSCTFGALNEGITEAELSAIALFISQRTGESWEPVPGSRPSR